MALRRGVVVVLFVCMVGFDTMADGDQLSYDFYDASCPLVERIVKQGLGPTFVTDPTMPAALLRLLFHDCQVQGCDASILLDAGSGENVTSEMASGKNFGIRGRDLIDMIKLTVEIECPLTVSCADIIVLAARDAVAISGGPQIEVPLGRRDARKSSYSLADATLPSATTGVDEMLQIFAKKGMTAEESVAILGSHTLGITHCKNIISSLDVTRSRSQFQSFLKFRCPKAIPAVNSLFVANDLTNLAFDNQYFRDTLMGRGALRIDSDMSVDPRTAPIVARFALDEAFFFQSFTSAFLKLSSYGVLTGNQGGVRRSCNRID